MINIQNYFLNKKTSTKECRAMTKFYVSPTSQEKVTGREYFSAQLSADQIIN